MTKPLMIDGDGHVFEPDDVWTERMDAGKWGDWIPHKVVEDEIYETIYFGGEVRSGGRELHDQMAGAVGLTPKQFFDLTAALRVPGGHDPDARIEALDVDDVDATVMYPSMALFFGPSDPIEALHNHEFVRDCIVAYNDWIADFCAKHPTRLFGVAGVPLQNIDMAIAEAQRACGERGLKGVFVRPSAYIDELPFNHSVYDPFWAACQELDVPVAFHPGVHVDTPGACRKFGLVMPSQNMTETNMAMTEIYGGSGLGQAVGNAVDMIVTMGRILMGGVCERFPDLNFIFLEAGGGWVPSILERMDEQVESFPLEKRWLSMLPSDYFKRQCYVSFEPEEWNIADCARFLGSDRLIWASDFPHPEYHPGLIKEVVERVQPLPPEDQANILGRNAVTVYKLGL
jgi:predicted TIM-barrel fold metal-dependent hydrolase